MTQQMILVNHPIYDQTCKYYSHHTNSGCKYGEHCHYKHLQPCSTSPYQTLLQYHQINNQLLHQILTCLQTVIAQTTTTIPQPPVTQSEPSVVHELKRDTPTPTPTLAQLPLPELSSVPIPIVTPTTTTDLPTPRLIKPHPVTKAVKIYQNIKEKPIVSSPVSPITSFYCRLKEIWPNIEYNGHFQQSPQPQIIHEYQRAQMLHQIDIEYNKLFDSMS